jgi:hypothetical protein
MQHFKKKPDNYKGEDSRQFKAYRALTEADKLEWKERGQELTHLKICLEYNEGGQNYFSGGYNKRGFRVCVTPVTLNLNIESYMMMGDRRNCGGYVLIEEAKRYNKKRLLELAEKYDDKVEAIAQAVIIDDVHTLVKLIQGDTPPARTPDPAPKPETMWNPPTDAQLAALPLIYSTENIPLQEKIVRMHFFLAGCDWYAVEYNPKERLFWGFVVLNGDLECAEWGMFSLDELKDLKSGFVRLDRDLHWKVRPAREVELIVKAQRWQVREGAAS